LSARATAAGKISEAWGDFDITQNLPRNKSMLILFYLKSSMTELADHQGQAIEGHTLNDVADGLPDLGWC